MKEAINKVHALLRDRKIHPCGYFDKAGRWHSDNSDLIKVRPPSRSWPYSQMIACRSKKYVTACYLKFECKNEVDLLGVV